MLDKIAQKSIISECVKQWDEQKEESKLVTIAKKKIDDEVFLKTHQELKGAVYNGIVDCLKTKRGNYYEFALREICSYFEHLTIFHQNILPTKDSENEDRMKNQCRIHVPLEITYFVNAIETEIREKRISYRNEDDVKAVMSKLYNETLRIKKIYNSKEYNPADYTDYLLDLDLGIYDSNLDEYFLYEVKARGKGGGDVIPEHIHKLFMKYCSIVFNNDVSFEKIHFAWVLVADFENNKLYKGNGGYIELETFLERHCVTLSAEFKNIIFEEISCTDDKEVYEIVKRVMRLYKELDGCADRKSANYKTPAQFKASYKKFYNSRFEKIK